MEEVRYRHRQYARHTAPWLLLGVLVGAVLAIALPDGTSGLPLLFTCSALMLVMSSLTVEVGPDALRVRYGIGWPRFSFPLDGIEDAVPVRTHPWNGWGIRLTPTGWLFNVSGLDAVEVRYRTGRRIRVGTDDPAGLAAAIRNAAGRS
ncbi:MAG: hypothetical protein ACKO5K_15330 [Armatimonadota bacterium]